VQETLERWAKQPPVNSKGVTAQTWAAQRHFVKSSRLRQLADVGFPVTVITGTNDYLVHPSGSHKLAKLLKPSEFIILDGAGHSIFIERFEEVRVCTWAPHTQPASDRRVASQFNQAIVRSVRRGILLAERRNATTTTTTTTTST